MAVQLVTEFFGHALVKVECTGSFGSWGADHWHALVTEEVCIIIIIQHRIEIHLWLELNRLLHHLEHSVVLHQHSGFLHLKI